MRVVEQSVLQTYTLELLGAKAYSLREAMELADLIYQGLLETQEDLNDLLPEGYSVRINEWDA